MSTVPHLIIFPSALTNSCLVNSWENLGQRWQVYSSPATPSVRDKPSACPSLHLPSPLHSKERAAGRFDMLQALSPSSQVQYSRAGTMHHQVLCSPGSWGWALPMLLLTWAVLLCSVRANAKKASCSLALWHCAHACPSCCVTSLPLLLQGELPALPAPLPAQGCTCMGFSCPCPLLFSGCQV